MKDFTKTLIAAAFFLFLVIAFFVLQGLQSVGGGMAGWGVTIVSGLAYWVFIDWVYRTKVGKKYPPK